MESTSLWFSVGCASGCTNFSFLNNGKVSTITFILVGMSLPCYHTQFSIENNKKTTFWHTLREKTPGTVYPLCRVAVASRQYCIEFPRPFHIRYLGISPHIFAGYEIWQMTMTQSGPTTLFSWAGLHFLFVFPWRSHFSPGVLIFGSIFDVWNLTNASTECAWWVYILCHRRCGIPLTLLSIFVGLPLSSVEYKSL